MIGEAFRLHVGEMQPEAHVRPAAVRHEGELVAAAGGFLGEAQRIEFLRLRPNLRHVVRVELIDGDARARGELISAEFRVAQDWRGSDGTGGMSSKDSLNAISVAGSSSSRS